MRYTLILFIGFLIFSCKRIEPLQGTVATYSTNSVKVQPKTILVDFSLSYDSLLTYFGLEKGRSLYNSEKQAGIDFPLRLDLIAKPQINVRKANNVLLKLPVEVQAKPNIAGINTGLIQAKSTIQLDFKWLWKDINHHQVDDLQIGYSWNAKPEMRVLGFPILVHGIVDPLIQKNLPDIQTKIEKQVNQWLSPNNLGNLINRMPMNYPTELGEIRLTSADVDLKDLIFDDKKITGKLHVRTALSLSDEMENPKPNRWVELQSTGNKLPFQVDYSFGRLAKMISASLKIKENQVNVWADSTSMQVKLVGLAGSNSSIQLRVKPLLLADGRISVAWSTIEMNGISFLMRGITKRRIKKGLGMFAWSIDPYLNRFNQNAWGLKLVDGKLAISSLYYTMNSVGIHGEVGGNWELKK